MQHEDLGSWSMSQELDKSSGVTNLLNHGAVSLEDYKTGKCPLVSG